MGLGGISPGSLLLIFLIVVLLFGTKKLASLGEDLGKAIHGFKKGLKEAQNELNNTTSSNTTPDNPNPIHQSRTDSPHDS